MKSATIISFFDSDNIGDLILSKKLYDIYNERIKCNKIDFVTGEIIEKEKLYININDTVYLNNSRNIKEKLKNISFVNEIIDLKNSLRCIKKINWIRVEEIIKKSDIVIIGGGNMFMGLSYDFPLLIRRYINISKKLNKDIRVVSVGVGPFKNSMVKHIIKTAINDIDKISVRDSLSKTYLKDITNKENINLSCDPAMLYELKCINKERDKIGVSVYPYKNPIFNKKGDLLAYKRYIKEFSQLIIEVNKRLNKKIILFSTEANDYYAVKDVYDSLDSFTQKECEIVQIKSYTELICLYDDIKILIGTRLHSMILAYTQNIPILGLSWQEKVDGFFKCIDKEKLYFDINNINKNSEIIIKRLEDIESHYNGYVNEIIEKREEIIKDFEINLIDV